MKGRSELGNAAYGICGRKDYVGLVVTEGRDFEAMVRRRGYRVSVVLM